MVSVIIDRQTVVTLCIIHMHLFHLCVGFPVFFEKGDGCVLFVEPVQVFCDWPTEVT